MKYHVLMREEYVHYITYEVEANSDIEAEFIALEGQGTLIKDEKGEFLNDNVLSTKLVTPEA